MIIIIIIIIFDFFSYYYRELLLPDDRQAIHAANISVARRRLFVLHASIKHNAHR